MVHLNINVIYVQWWRAAHRVGSEWKLAVAVTCLQKLLCHIDFCGALFNRVLAT
jgi:hypothetical protein